MRDSADDEARVATVDARQGLAEADRGPAGDAGGQKERPSFPSAGRELAGVQGGDGGFPVGAAAGASRLGTQLEYHRHRAFPQLSGMLLP
jgi:hypothetical protein